MGCFLTCFGFKKKRKSPRPGKKSRSAAGQNHGNYVPLDSDVSIKLDIKENSITSDSNHLKEKNPKEPPMSKTKKKVSFNLNVKTYEPIPNDDEDDIVNYLSEGEEETKWEFNTETNSTATNYRYSFVDNDEDSFVDNDEDDELEFDDNDLDFEVTEDSDNGSDDILSNESDGNEVIYYRDSDDENKNIELQGLKSKINGRYVLSVLNPVENLTQWKKLKAKAEKGPMTCEKENLSSKLDEESFLGKRPDPDSLNFKKFRNYSNASRYSERTIAVDASNPKWNTWEI